VLVLDRNLRKPANRFLKRHIQKVSNSLSKLPWLKLRVGLQTVWFYKLRLQGQSVTVASPLPVLVQPLPKLYVADSSTCRELHMANTLCMLPCVACNLAAAKAFGLPTAEFLQFFKLLPHTLPLALLMPHALWIP
jgi:hypothetical protein